MKLGQYKNAIDSFKEAEKVTVVRLGTKDHAIVMNILFNMGQAYSSIALFSFSRESTAAKNKAILCYSESKQISQACFGKQHTSSAEVLGSLGALYAKSGNAWLEILNEEKSDDENDDELAYKSFKQSLSIRKREKGSSNELEIASILQHLGGLCLRRIGYYYRCDDTEALKFANDAMKFLSESLKIQKILLGPDTINTADTHYMIGRAHLNRALALKDNANKVEYEITKAHSSLSTSLNQLLSSQAIKSVGPRLSGELKDSILMKALCHFYLGRVEQTKSEMGIFECSDYDRAKSHYIDALRLFQAEGKHRLSRIEDDVVDLE